MFCTNCGAQCPDNSAKCQNCGAPLQSAQPQPAQPQPHPMYPVAPVVPGKGMGVASLVLGIISLVLFCFLPVSMPCGLIAIILGAVGMMKAKQAGMSNGTATAGLVCGCIAIGLALLLSLIARSLLGELFEIWIELLGL